MRIEGMAHDQSNTDLRGDILIANGKIVDGCGNPWYYGDIGVKNGYIVSVGDLGTADYDLVIDASGKVVSPGFIDMHSGISSADPLSESKIRQGVTTVVGGAGETDAIVISSFLAEPELQGKTLQQAADLKGFGVAEQVMYMIQNGRAVCHYHVMSTLDVEHIMSSLWVAIGSDAGVVPPESGSIEHPRSYGTFPRILDYYVKEIQLLSLEDAVRKTTSLPAQILGIRNRGRILEGHKADLVVLDLSELRDNSTFEHPDRFPDGIEWVIVNGVVVLSHGKHTGEKPGEPIYGAGRK